MSLVDLLRAAADRHPERTALRDAASGRPIAYAALVTDVDAVARSLRAAGVARGQRIALVGSNSLAYVGVAFGVLAAGACVVPAAANLRAREQEAILAGVDVHGVVRVPEDGSAWSFAWRDRGASEPPGFAALDPAFVRFSSGTTADAKGVVLSHRATLARIAAAGAVVQISCEDRVFWTLPLAYHFAVTIPAYLGAGAEIVLCAETRPARMAAALGEHGTTVLYASPTQLERIAALGTPAPALRLALSTAAPLRPEVAARFHERVGVPLGQASGIIEAGLACINTRADPTVPAESVGRPVPGYEVAIVDASGARVADGTPGEVLVRGPGLFDAYYAPWTPRDAVTRDGWFATGDVGAVDATGALTLLGRIKSTIVVAGMKFFPEEVEACLTRFPGIAEARVFAEAHPLLGELPHADVVLAPGTTSLDRDAIEAHCARELSPYKVPVAFRVVANIPRTASGKIVRRSAATPASA